MHTLVGCTSVALWFIQTQHFPAVPVAQDKENHLLKAKGRSCKWFSVHIHSLVNLH